MSTNREVAAIQSILWRGISLPGLEKIKTIGDYYMVAAGVPHPRADHVLVAARMALEIQEHMGQHLFQDHSLDFRTGTHSGSAVAGVIDTKKFF